MGVKRRDLRDALWSRVKIGPPDECWPWMKGRDKNGYGDFKNGGKHYRTHRLAFTLTRGPVPDNLQVLHRCDNPSCCNPAHLYAGTPKRNMQDKMERGRWKGGSPPGERHGSAKLTDDNVLEIIRLHNAREAGIREIARQFGVTHPQIIRIIKGTGWRHIPR